MTTFNIILICALGALLAIALLVIIVALVIMNKIINNRVIDQQLLNGYSPLDPIVFLGDSLTDFYPINEFFHDERIVNRGIASDTTFDVIGRLNSIIKLKPKTVFLQIGINDFIHSFFRVKPKLVFNRIVSIVDKLKGVCEVKIISLYPINARKKFFSRLMLMHARNSDISKVNEMLANYCANSQLTYIDVYSALTDEKGRLKKEFTIEGLHLTVKGYEAVSKVIKEHLSNIE